MILVFLNYEARIGHMYR